MPMVYSLKFKEKMVAKLIGPGARSLASLSEEAGVPRSTLWTWLRVAKIRPMSKEGERSSGKDSNALGNRKRWTPEEKIRVVLEATAEGEAGLGALLRREGLHEEDLKCFREEVLEAAARGFAVGRRKRGLSPEQKELRKLKKELVRKEKALAETAALLVLRKKAEAFFQWEEEGDDTNEDND